LGAFCFAVPSGNTSISTTRSTVPVKVKSTAEQMSIPTSRPSKIANWMGTDRSSRPSAILAPFAFKVTLPPLPQAAVIGEVDRDRRLAFRQGLVAHEGRLP